jgi:hypothetical protein
MAYTGQSEVDELRLILQEPDPENSRWQDPMLLSYVNRGRRKYAEESLAVKAIFERTTDIGPTVLGNDLVARYPLDATTLELDAVRYDGLPVAIEGEQGWDEKLSGFRTNEQGIPFMAVRRGGLVDLFYAPSEAKTLEYLASVITVDLSLTEADSELADTQVRVALDYSAYEALTDDGRDGTIYLARAEAMARKHKRRLARPGPKFVHSTSMMGY